MRGLILFVAHTQSFIYTQVFSLMLHITTPNIYIDYIGKQLY